MQRSNFLYFQSLDDEDNNLLSIYWICLSDEQVFLEKPKDT